MSEINVYTAGCHKDAQVWYGVTGEDFCKFSEWVNQCPIGDFKPDLFADTLFLPNDERGFIAKNYLLASTLNKALVRASCNTVRCVYFSYIPFGNGADIYLIANADTDGGGLIATNANLSSVYGTPYHTFLTEDLT